MPEEDLKFLKDIKIIITEELKEKGASARTAIKASGFILLKPRISIQLGIKNSGVFAYDFVYIISNKNFLMKNEELLSM